MDNLKQIEEIEKYRQRLSRILEHEIDPDVAALIWIRRYAELWRAAHPSMAGACAR